MISAELSHNPYLLLTSVKFNGQAPRINSQIEKHEHQPLKDWVHLVPSIFYDEMNGYDFDFLFTGTSPDFEEVKLAFKLAGVSESDVRLIHKNEIEDADTKSQEVDELVNWLRENPNRKFNFSSFWNENLELFEGAYTYIVLGGSAPEKSDSHIEVETISSAKELSTTVLTSTPILLYISSENIDQRRKDLNILLSRKDVRQEQLFFMINPAMNHHQITRTIEDLGVSAPQVVSDYFDEAIKKYIRNYPVTEYIRDVIAVFEAVAEDIDTILEAENEESIAINAGIHAKIDLLEASILRLKETDNFFVQRDNFVAPYSFESAKDELIDQIRKWRNRKTKIVGDVEADNAAIEYDTYLSRAFQSFINRVTDITRTAASEIQSDLHSTYEGGQIDTSYYPEANGFNSASTIISPSLKDEFIALKQITFEEAKGDFFGLFKKSPDVEPEQIRVATSYLEQWRSVAEEKLLYLAERFIAENSAALSKYYALQAEDYHNHLIGLLTELSAEKEQVASTLSDEEKKLQQDNDWLATFRDKLYTIERG